MENLLIDLETYSSADISKCGVYRYVESADFQVLLFGYSVDFGEARVVDLASGERLPPEIAEAIRDGRVLKWAHNASFERIALSRLLGLPPHSYLDPSSWRCSMVYASCLSLPKSLRELGFILDIDRQKLDEGKDLIRYFSVPCRPTKPNGMRTRNLPCDDPARWDAFRAYNRRDVEAECEVVSRLKRHALPEGIWQEYAESEAINDRGVLVDGKLVGNAIEISADAGVRLRERLRRLTDLDNPNSVSQLKGWLKDCGLEVSDLGKKNVRRILADAPGGLISLVLALRLQTSKSSVKKYEAIRNCECSDGRVRGMFQFCGAARTGRFASKFVQLQNLPQNHMANLGDVRELVRKGESETLGLLYDDIPDVLSQLIRTAFVPKEGRKFIVADFSAIEARVLAWYAGEKWVLDAFKNGEDIYCATASRMYGVPVAKHGTNGELRQKGKQATLSCGYGGGVGALKAMGALDAGLKEGELQGLVDSWRDANPHIVSFWWDVDKAVRKACSERVTVRLGGLLFSCRGAMTYVTLPSGRSLAYVRLRVREDGRIVYEGKLPNNKWGEIESYGPKFVENIVQGTARDILCNSIHNLRGYDIVMHIHDEVVVEAYKDAKVEDITSLMGKSPSWAGDLLLRADGYECDFYQKD